MQRRRYCAASPSTALSPSQGCLPEQRMPNASWETAPDGTIQNQPEHPNLFRRELKLGLQQQLVINTILQLIGTSKQATNPTSGLPRRPPSMYADVSHAAALLLAGEGPGGWTWDQGGAAFAQLVLVGTMSFQSAGGRDSPPRTLSSRLSPVRRALSSRPR